MRCIKRLNPLAWSRKTTIIAIVVFFAAFIPTYFAYGLSPLPLDFSNVEKVQLDGGTIPVPDHKIGALEFSPSLTLLVGHHTGVFRSLNTLSENDIIPYAGKTFIVRRIDLVPLESVSMQRILTPEPGQNALRVMTCSGAYDNSLGTYVDRLIIYATEA